METTIPCNPALKDDDEEDLDAEDLDAEMRQMASMGLPTSFTGRLTFRSNNNIRNHDDDDIEAVHVSTSDDNDAAEKAFSRYWLLNGSDILDRTFRTRFPNLNESDFVAGVDFSGGDTGDETGWDRIWAKHSIAIYEEEKHKFFINYNRGRLRTQIPSSFSSDRNGSVGSEADDPPDELPSIVKREDAFDELSLQEDTPSKPHKLYASLFSGSSVEFKDKGQRSVTSTPQPPEVLPEKHHKYWHQRYRLFSKFDEGIRLDQESWYSVTPEEIAKHIAKRCVTYNDTKVIIDGFCGAGGNTIQFALASPDIHVIAIDIDPEKIALAMNNARVYGALDRIDFIKGDFFEVLPRLSQEMTADVVFLSPPWGGPSYLNQDVFKLRNIQPSVCDCMHMIRRYMTQDIALLVPRNTDENDLRELAGGEGMSVEIEQNLCNKKVKTVTAYFGALVSNDKPWKRRQSSSLSSSPMLF